MGCLLDDLRAFGIKTDQWTIAAQDAEEWYKTANKGAEFFTKNWITADGASTGGQLGYAFENAFEEAFKPFRRSRLISF